MTPGSMPENLGIENKTKQQAPNFPLRSVEVGNTKRTPFAWGS